MKLCSACLLGVKCRYDGKSKPNEKVLALSKKEVLIPICPEQFGGLPTPREPSEQRGKEVVTKTGKSVTENFENGAKEVLKLAKLFNINETILKQRSPSCGFGQIYKAVFDKEGNFLDKIIRGDGVTTALLKQNRIKLKTEEDL